MRPSRQNLAEFVDALQASGRYTFSRDEALGALEMSEVALKEAARRLVDRRRLAVPRRGFFVIVPLEYREAGAPPPSWFIDDFMKSLGRYYYVGLLSAAALHGAAHQQPQEFQVVTDKTLRRTAVGRTRIRFFLKSRPGGTPLVAVKTETGHMKVSTPEATALDLVRYVRGAGRLGNVVTVLAELAETIDPEALLAAAKDDVEMSVIQRLGYLLDQVSGRHLTEPLAGWLAHQEIWPVPLRPGRSARGAPRDARWAVLVNEVVRPET